MSFGDIHIKPYSDDTIGINSLIVRTPQMNELLQQAMTDGAIVVEELNEATLVASQKMGRVKKTKYGANERVTRTWRRRFFAYGSANLVA